MGQALPFSQPASLVLPPQIGSLAKNNDMPGASAALAQWMDQLITAKVDVPPDSVKKRPDEWYVACALRARRDATLGNRERWTDYNVLSAMVLAPLRPAWARNGTSHPTVSEIRTSMA